MPRTTLELLDERGREIEALIDELLTQHSGIRVFRNDPSSGIVAIGFKNSWVTLEQPGVLLQSRILRQLERYEPLVKTLLRGAPTKTTKDAEEASATIRDAVDQSAGTHYETPARVLETVREAFESQRKHLASLYDPTPGVDVYVPDANAIIWNPSLEEWEFDDSPRFSVVLTSTLLGELDDLKMSHRAESVREKAESAIRRIKEYGKRGDIDVGVGVPLRRDRSTVRSTAVEPDFEAAPAWLDPTVKDDRLIASVLEVVREHPQSPVILVTRDVNMQNKARHAGIPFVEPPDPVEEVKPKPKRLPNVPILSIRTAGGADGWVNFIADVQNREPTQLRLDFAARVDDDTVDCNPSQRDVIANQMPMQLAIQVPRPRLGDLIHAFGGENATTLYGRTLTVEVIVDGDVVATKTWHEHEYTLEENSDRHEIQQRVWRIGRGEGTPADDEADLRAEARARRFEAVSRNQHQHD